MSVCKKPFKRLQCTFPERNLCLGNVSTSKEREVFFSHEALCSIPYVAIRVILIICFRFLRGNKLHLFILLMRKSHRPRPCSSENRLGSLMTGTASTKLTEICPVKSTPLYRQTKEGIGNENILLTCFTNDDGKSIGSSLTAVCGFSIKLT